MKESLQSKVDALVYFDASIKIKDKILRKIDDGGIDKPVILAPRGGCMPKKFYEPEFNFWLIRSALEK